jgi:hypothetical protein
LRSCIGTIASLNFATTVYQLLYRRAEQFPCLSTQSNWFCLCTLFPQDSLERETMRQFVHFLPQLLHEQGL